MAITVIPVLCHFIVFVIVQRLASFCAGCICVFCFVAVMNIYVSIAVSFEVACASIHVFFHVPQKFGNTVFHKLLGGF